MLKTLNIGMLEENIKKVRDDRRQKEKLVVHIETLLKDTDKMEQRRTKIETKLATLKKDKKSL